MKTYGSRTEYEASDYGLRFDWAGFHERQQKWSAQTKAEGQTTRDKEQQCPPPQPKK